MLRQSKLSLIGFFSLVFISVLHFLTFHYPFLYEDEALYLDFAINKPVALDSGIVWKMIIRFSSLFLDGDNFKMVMILFGLLSGVAFYHILRKGIRLGTLASYVITAIYLVSPIFFSQAHRIRPEIIQNFFALSSVLFFVLSINKRNTGLKNIFLDPLFLIGMTCFALIPHSHIMGILHLPAVGVILVYLFFGCTKSVKQTLLGLIISGMVFLIVLIGLLPAILHANPQHFDAFKSSGILDTINRSIESFKISFVVWYWDVRLHSLHKPRNNFFSAGKHLMFDGVMLYLMSIFVGLIACCKTFITRKVQLKDAIAIAAFANCVFYVVAIILFQRHNNSYNIGLLPWMLMVISYIFSDFNFDNTFHKAAHKTIRFFVSILLGASVYIAITHFRYYIYPARHTNFNNALNELRLALKENNCSELSAVSAPYFVFLKSKGVTPFPLGTIIAENSIKTHQEGFTGKYYDILKKPKTCGAIIARNYYGFEWWGQYADSVEKLRLIIGKEFRVVAEISMPFYKNDIFFPTTKKNKRGVEYPIGADTIYLGGLEKIWIITPRSDRITK